MNFADYYMPSWSFWLELDPAPVESSSGAGRLATTLFYDVLKQAAAKKFFEQFPDWDPELVTDWSLWVWTPDALEETRRILLGRSDLDNNWRSVVTKHRGGGLVFIEPDRGVKVVEWSH